MKTVWDVFFMLGGVAAMMIGMKIMGGGLEQLAGGRMKKMLGKITGNRFAGVGVGVAVTGIIQSSTATTVMLVGFVNIGLLTLTQATNVIMGANIGTTITAHIVSLSGVGDIEIGAIAAAIGCLGMFMSMFIKNEKAKTLGNILAGLGMIFVGLEFISTYAKAIMFENGMPRPWVEAIFIKDHFPLLLLLIGIVLTAMVHSSSTITSLMVVLASIGVLSFKNALFLALGSNIGTCITSLMSSAGTSTNAKRTAVVHLLFNLFGCILFIAPLWIWGEKITLLFEKLSNDAGQQIAIFHTLFNILTTLVLLPFTKLVVNLACKLVPEKKVKEDERYNFHFLDDRLLTTPPIAAGNVKKEIVRMSEFARDNINYSMEMLLDGANHSETIKYNEDVINHLNKNLASYLTKLMSAELTHEDERKVGSYYHVISDVERVGDYAENIMEYVDRLNADGLSISEDGKKELRELQTAVNELYDYAITAFDDRNVNLLIDVEEVEDKIDQICATLENKHIERLKKGNCSAQAGSVYLQTVSNLERVADHITNIAMSIRQYRGGEKAVINA